VQHWAGRVASIPALPPASLCQMTAVPSNHIYPLIVGCRYYQRDICGLKRERNILRFMCVYLLICVALLKMEATISTNQQPLWLLSFKPAGSHATAAAAATTATLRAALSAHVTNAYQATKDSYIFLTAAAAGTCTTSLAHMTQAVYLGCEVVGDWATWVSRDAGQAVAVSAAGTCRAVLHAAQHQVMVPLVVGVEGAGHRLATSAQHATANAAEKLSETAGAARAAAVYLVNGMRGALPMICISWGGLPSSIACLVLVLLACCWAAARWVPRWVAGGSGGCEQGCEGPRDFCAAILQGSSRNVCGCSETVVTGIDSSNAGDNYQPFIVSSSKSSSSGCSSAFDAHGSALVRASSAPCRMFLHCEDQRSPSQLRTSSLTLPTPSPQSTTSNAIIKCSTTQAFRLHAVSSTDHHCTSLSRTTSISSMVFDAEPCDPIEPPTCLGAGGSPNACPSRQKGIQGIIDGTDTDSGHLSKDIEV